MLLILVQLALLLLTAWGWGFWLWKASGAARHPGWRVHGWYFFGLAGLMACVLFLHALLYFDLELRYTSWAALAVGIGGVLAFFLRGKGGPDGMRHRRRREVLAAAAVFAAVFGLQSADLFHAGPENYYGNAHTDQVNYVMLAEFLVEKPYSTELKDVGLQPWLAKGVSLKGTRLGQSVANGYLGVVSLVDAKRSYGTLGIFMLGAAALAVFVLARLWAVGRALAALTAGWWGTLPAITKMHLDGFFSQTCVLVVFPAMAAVFYVRRGRLERTPLLLLTVYLAYLLCAYTEVYAIGVGLLASLVLLAAGPGTPWLRRGAAVAAAAVGSLLLNGSYVRYFFAYVDMQYRTAADPLALADLVPASGTWIGWKQIFFGPLPFADARLERLSLLAGFAVLFGMVAAFQSRHLARRRYLLAVVAPPLGIMALLLSAPKFSKYPFAKLLDTFTTLWLPLAVLGALSLAALLPRSRRWLGSGLAWAAAGGLALAALGGSWPQWRDTWQDKGILADVDSPGARLSYARAQDDPSAVYFIDEAHTIVCAWLAYAARHSKVYVDVDHVSDLPVPATSYAFRRPPEATDSLTVIDEKGPKRLRDYQGPPNLQVRNPQGIDGGGDGTFYWIGPDAALELWDYSPPGSPERRFLLNFVAMAGPANPVPERTLVLVDPDGNEQKIDFTTSTTGHFEVTVRPGKTVYTLKVAYPTEQTFKIPVDPRNHMVRLQQLALTAAPPAP